MYTCMCCVNVMCSVYMRARRRDLTRSFITTPVSMSCVCVCRANDEYFPSKLFSSSLAADLANNSCVCVCVCVCLMFPYLAIRFFALSSHELWNVFQQTVMYVVQTKTISYPFSAPYSYKSFVVLHFFHSPFFFPSFWAQMMDRSDCQHYKNRRRQQYTNSIWCWHG